jgi:hypothetical protein
MKIGRFVNRKNKKTGEGRIWKEACYLAEAAADRGWARVRDGLRCEGDWTGPWDARSVSGVRDKKFGLISQKWELNSQSPQAEHRNGPSGLRLLMSILGRLLVKRSVSLRGI